MTQNELIYSILEAVKDDFDDVDNIRYNVSRLVAQYTKDLKDLCILESTAKVSDVITAAFEMVE